MKIRAALLGLGLVGILIPSAQADPGASGGAQVVDNYGACVMSADISMIVCGVSTTMASSSGSTHHATYLSAQRQYRRKTKSFYPGVVPGVVAIDSRLGVASLHGQLTSNDGSTCDVNMTLHRSEETASSGSVPEGLRGETNPPMHSTHTHASGAMAWAARNFISFEMVDHVGGACGWKKLDDGYAFIGRWSSASASVSATAL